MTTIGKDCHTDSDCQSTKEYCMYEGSTNSNLASLKVGSFDACSSNQVGKCTVKPEFCIEIYAPVCGCDGETYGNFCFASMEGVNLAYEGNCLARTNTKKQFRTSSIEDEKEKTNTTSSANALNIRNFSFQNVIYLGLVMIFGCVANLM